MSSGWWVAEYLHADPALLLSWIVWVIGSIVLHELAHGWAALHEGDSTPRDLGHMTWNPLVHMGGLSLIMFALVGIAWGLMPVSPDRFRSEHGEAKVALAGPLMNVGLAVAAIILGGIWMSYFGWLGYDVWSAVMTFFFTGAFLNILLALFNLIPIPPLDGSTILATFVPAYRELKANPRFAMVSMLLFLLVFFNAGQVIFEPAREIARGGINAVTRVLPGEVVGPPTPEPGAQESSRANLEWLQEEFSDEELVRLFGATPDQIRRLRSGRISPGEADELVARLRQAEPSP